MSRSARRTWTAKSDSPEIIRALSSANLQIFRLRHALRQFPHTIKEIVENPMHPGTSRCIRVIHDQGKCFGAGRRVIPGKCW